MILKKISDYHAMMDEILNSFKQAQQEAIAWILEYKSQNYKVYFRCPVMFIIGDTDGHDKLIGKYGNRNNTARLCRYCNCPFDETDNPWFSFKPVSQKTVQNLIAKNDKKNLKQCLCIALKMRGMMYCSVTMSVVFMVVLLLK